MKVYSVTDLANLFQVNPETIKRSVRKGIFPAPQRIGRKWRWHEEVISAWLKEPADPQKSHLPRRGRPREA